MADENKNIETEETEVTETEEQKEETGGKEAEENQPTTQELYLEIAKLKRQVDKASSEAADWKKKYRSTQSAKEVTDAEKAEAQAKREEEIEAMRRELAINRTEKSYLGMGYTADEASRMAVAEVDGDFDMRIKIMSEVEARKKKAYEAEWIKSRPEINHGSDKETEDLFIKGFNSVKPNF